MRLPAIACASLLSACFSKPGFHGGPGDGGGSDTGGPGLLHGVRVLGNGVTDDMTVSTDDLELHFPMAPISLPDSLKIGGTEVLGDQTGCNPEAKIGLAFYPVYTMTSGTTAWPTETGDQHDSSIAGSATGPAFARTRVSWLGTFHCGVTTQMMSGASTFTVFPDGRVVRHDQFDTPTTTTIGAASCGCGGGVGNYFLTSYLTLLNDRFTHLGFNASTNNLPMPTETTLASLHDADSVENPNPRWACLENRDAAAQRRFGIAWPASVMPTVDDGGTRIKLEIDTPPMPTTTLLYDWSNDDPSVAAGVRQVSTAWFVDAGANATCNATEMTDLFNGYAFARRLDVDQGGTGVLVPLDVSTGIYAVGGAAVPSYSIKVETALTGVPPGFAISLSFPSDAAPGVALNGVPLVDGVDYLVQHEAAVHTLWFAAGLAQGQTLTVFEK